MKRVCPKCKSAELENKPMGRPPITCKGCGWTGWNLQLVKSKPKPS